MKRLLFPLLYPLLFIGKKKKTKNMEWKKVIKMERNSYQYEADDNKTIACTNRTNLWHMLHCPVGAQRQWAGFPLPGKPHPWRCSRCQSHGDRWSRSDSSSERASPAVSQPTGYAVPLCTLLPGGLVEGRGFVKTATPYSFVNENLTLFNHNH